MTDNSNGFDAAMHVLLDLSSLGARFCRLPSGAKAPDYPEWQKTPLTYAEVEAHLAGGGNAGLLTGAPSGGMCMLDLDENLSGFLVAFPNLAKSPRIVRKGADRGKILVFLRDPPAGRKWHRGLNGPIEFLSTGQQGVVPPSVHPSGEKYEWAGDTSVPMLAQRELRAVVEAWTGTPWPAPGEGPQGPAEADNPPPLEELTLVMQTLPASFVEDYETWRDVGMSLHSAYPGQDGLKAWDEWSKGSKKWRSGGCAGAWKSFGSYTGVLVTWRSLFWWAEEARIVQMMEPAERGASLVSPTRTRVAELVESGAFPASDVGLGELFAALYKEQVRFVPSHGWFIWTGKVWEPDNRLTVYRKMFALYKSALREINRRLTELAKERSRLAQAGGDSIDLPTAAARAAELSVVEKGLVELKAAVIRLGLMPKLEAALSAARAQQGVVAIIEEFDSDPWLLNLQNGMLDLRTLELKPHNPAAMCSKLAHVAYDPTAECHEWTRFVSEVFVERYSDGSIGQSEEMVKFAQRAAGFSLQGVPMKDTEQVFFFCHGTGSNGKSTFVGLLADILGTYAVTVRSTALMIVPSKTQAEDIAHFPGIRMAVAPELPIGSRMDESLVKSLTGDAIVRARHLYKSSFEFVPRAKIWMHGNHRPEIRDAGDGTWRRLMLMPFEARFPDGKRDSGLPARLSEERSGILNWCLEGLVAWASDGLAPPGFVKTASLEYRESENRFEQFLDEMVEFKPTASVVFRELYAVYKKWCDDNGEFVLRPKTFTAELESYAKIHEFRLGKTRLGNSKGFNGIELTAEGKTQAMMLTQEF
jgi:P4 family phage/plasmid primase-like protien